MQTRNTTTLTTVLSDVLADLAFMFTDEADLNVPAEERWLETCVSYRGTESGTLALTCTATFAAALAANLLAVDPGEETTDQEADDAVKEFMNVVCGQYVTAAFGADDVFDLTIPKAVELSTTPDLSDPADPMGDVTILSVGGQSLRLRHTRSA